MIIIPYLFIYVIASCSAVAKHTQRRYGILMSATQRNYWKCLITAYATRLTAAVTQTPHAISTTVMASGQRAIVA